MLACDRVGEVLTARIEQFNLDYAIWSKPASTTKQRKIHRVQISQDVAAIVRLGVDVAWLNARKRPGGRSADL